MATPLSLIRSFAKLSVIIMKICLFTHIVLRGPQRYSQPLEVHDSDGSPNHALLTYKTWMHPQLPHFRHSWLHSNFNPQPSEESDFDAPSHIITKTSLAGLPTTPLQTYMTQMGLNFYTHSSSDSHSLIDRYANTTLRVWVCLKQLGVLIVLR